MIIIMGISFPFFVKTIKQGENAIILTLGKYSSTVGPGIVFLFPGIQSCQRVNLREQVINVPEQQIITKDNVGVTVDGIVYVQIMDSYKATFAIENVYFGVVSLAQTSLRSVLGTMALDETLSNREIINAKLLETLDRETEKWGVKVMRVEIKRLDPPHDIMESMSKQMKAEREKRAQILEAEGYKQSLITKSEGDKQSQILRAEGDKESQVLRAIGEAEAKIKIAEATAKALELESIAASAYFTGPAVTKEQLNVIQNSLGGGNTKYILDSDILTSISKTF